MIFGRWNARKRRLARPVGFSIRNTFAYDMKFVCSKGCFSQKIKAFAYSVKRCRMINLFWKFRQRRKQKLTSLQLVELKLKTAYRRFVKACEPKRRLIWTTNSQRKVHQIKGGRYKIKISVLPYGSKRRMEHSELWIRKGCSLFSRANCQTRWERE